MGNLRNSLIKDAKTGVFDIAIIGGGIHGACIARMASQLGLRVLLLEAIDFAYGTSSRSSKLLHGGLRYLEKFNIGLVYEALQERAVFAHQAPHLTRPLEFFFPVMPGLTRPAWQIKCGLALYDFLANLFSARDLEAVNKLFKKHKKISKDSQGAKFLREQGLTFENLFSYFDGQMDDARLVVETVIDARELGAVTLNHAKVNNFEKKNNWSVSWRDELAGESYQSEARVLINTAGPWVSELHLSSLKWDENWYNPVYSRGAHLIFDFSWPIGGVFLPTGTSGRNYWILPHFSSQGKKTLVGTTDKVVSNNELDPKADGEEIAELLSFLKRDFSTEILSEKNLSDTFCGMRILASSPNIKKIGKVSDVSRSEKIYKEDEYILLLGGKYTTARASAEKILNMASEILGKQISKKNRESFIKRKLPGSLSKEYSQEALLFECKETLRNEIRHSILKEQACTVEDLFKRRFGVSSTDNVSQDFLVIAKEELEKFL